MRREELPPARPQRVNPPTDQDKLQRLIVSMRQRGWQGRPLLVEEAVHPRQRAFGHPLPEYFAWTGSHRLSAAESAPLARVPCAVLAAEETTEAFTRAGYREYWHWGHQCWMSAIIELEGPTDGDRLRALQEAGLHEAATILQNEMDAPEG